jgi:hypothetical protein
MTSPQTIFLISAGCIFGGALLGLLLQGLIPEHHLRDSSKDTVKVVAGTIATLAALVLGLLVGSAKNSFDALNTEITQSSTKIILLDRALAAYDTFCQRKKPKRRVRGL